MESSVSFVIGIFCFFDVNIFREKKVKNYILIFFFFILFRMMWIYILLFLLVFVFCELMNLVIGNCCNYCDNKNIGYGIRFCIKILIEMG